MLNLHSSHFTITSFDLCWCSLVVQSESYVFKVIPAVTYFLTPLQHSATQDF